MSERKNIENISREIQTRVEKEILDLTRKAGIYCRVFSRVKTVSSIKKKMTPTRYNANHKMQDLLGVRIIFYFHEDVDIFKRYLQYHFKYTYDSESTTLSDIKNDEVLLKSIKGGLRDKLFMPTRLNVVFRGDEYLKAKFDELFAELKTEEVEIAFIDYTFEVQFRTVLSEGWHEVEHDMRYKCKDDWENMLDESRMLNGIYATLETNEHTMAMLFTNMARKYYRHKNWEAMVRTIVRLHIIDSHISSDIRKHLEPYNSSIARGILNVKRENLIRALLLCPEDIPLTMDNIILMINQMQKSEIRNSLIKEYAHDNASAIYNMNRADVVGQLIKEEQATMAAQNIVISPTQTQMGIPISIISLKPEVVNVPTQFFIDEYTGRIEKKEIVVIDLDDIKTLNEKLTMKYIAPLFLNEFSRPVNFIWGALKNPESPEVLAFKEQIRKGIKKKLKLKGSSSVPNSVPELRIRQIPTTIWYEVALEDNIFN